MAASLAVAGPGTACPDGFPSPRPVRLVAIAAAMAVALVALELVAGILMWAGIDFSDLPVSLAAAGTSVIGEAVLTVAYAGMGGLLAARRPCSVVGWLFILAGLTEATTILATMLVAQAHQVVRPVGDLTLALAWLTSSWSLPALAALLVAVLVVFPDGRPLSRRWTLASVPGVAGAFLVGLGCAVDDRGLTWFPSLANPLGDTPLAPLTVELRAGGAIIGAAGLLLAVAATLVRYRRGDATLRAQLRWIVLAGLLLAGSMIPFLVVRYAVPAPGLAEALVLFAFGAGAFVPVAAAIAILRHHLYGMQVLVDRTLVYVPLMALSGGLYAGSVTLFQRLFVAFTGDTSDAAVILSSLLLASAFTPLRRSLEARVERHFHVPARTNAGVAAAERAPAETGADPAAIARFEELEARVERLERVEERAGRPELHGRRPSPAACNDPLVARPASATG